MKNKIKVGQIVSVDVHYKHVAPWHVYSKAFFGLFGEKTIRNISLGSLWEWKTSREEIYELGLYVENDKVYQKPFIEIHLVNERAYIKRFKTVNELVSFVDDISALPRETWLTL